MPNNSKFKVEQPCLFGGNPLVYTPKVDGFSDNLEVIVELEKKGIPLTEVTKEAFYSSDNCYVLENDLSAT